MKLKNVFLKTPMLYVLFVILLCSVASAEVSIDVSAPNSFSIGERVYFDYTLSSDVDVDLDYTAGVYCEEIRQPLLEVRSESLTANSPITLRVYDVLVSESMDFQLCHAYVETLDPVSISEEREFTIHVSPHDVTESFDFSLKICKDALCSFKSLIFLPQEELHIKYSSNENNINVETFLTYPDGTKSFITLPFKTDNLQPGTYSVESTASKVGFITRSQNYDFIVVQKPVKIKEEKICIIDGVCNNKENNKNCPNDCPSGSNDNFCDAIADDICDPDCEEKEDIDCIKPELKAVVEKQMERNEEPVKIIPKTTKPSKNVWQLIIALLLALIAFVLWALRKLK